MSSALITGEDQQVMIGFITKEVNQIIDTETLSNGILYLHMTVVK